MLCAADELSAAEDTCDTSDEVSRLLSFSACEAVCCVCDCDELADELSFSCEEELCDEHEQSRRAAASIAETTGPFIFLIFILSSPYRVFSYKNSTTLQNLCQAKKREDAADERPLDEYSYQKWPPPPLWLPPLPPPPLEPELIAVLEVCSETKMSSITPKLRSPPSR